jgi:pantoate--beta-alanine ligase
LASIAEADALFVPSVDEMYPVGFNTVVDVPEVAAVLEGAYRPGHFAGVATIVTKLLNIVQPDRAYFGQKDYQQVLLIERITRDLNMLGDIVMVSTAREPDGLALSSRNAYLSPEEREAAVVLSRALARAQEMLTGGETDAAVVRRAVEEIISDEPRARADYVALVNPNTLEPVSTLDDAVTLVALAVRIGRTRLIDNALIAPKGIPIARARPGKF